MSSIVNNNDNNSTAGNHIDTSSIWIYHERQNALLCGQHALNNLVQDPNGFTIHELSIIAQQLDAIELQYLSQNDEGGIYSKDYRQRQAEGSYHIDNSGNFSIEVLKVALQKNYNIILSHLTKNDLQIRKSNNSHINTTDTNSTSTAVSDITDYQGFVCHKSDHWFTIRKVGGRFWNMNSTLERPIVISHFKLAIDLEQYWTIGGYTIFCVPNGLPECGKKPSIVNNNWHRMIDLLNGKSTDINSVKDPWENVGSGMRLDNTNNKNNSKNNNMTNNATHPLNTMSTILPNGIQIDDLSEEEQLRLALQLSLGTSAATSNGSDSNGTKSTGTNQFTNGGSSSTLLLSLSDMHNLLLVPVPDEPQDGLDGVVKIRFRLPNNNKMIIRRFNVSDTIAVVYSFVVNAVGDTSSNNNKTTIELLYGYPPKDLVMTLIEQQSNTGTTIQQQQSIINLMTIEQVKLANESVQCRLR